MIKKLLGLLAVTLLLFGCSEQHGDVIDYGDLESGAQIEVREFSTFIMLKDICSVWPNSISQIEVSCEQIEDLDYVNNPPDDCELITFIDINGKSHTGLYDTFQKGPECD